MAPPVPDFVPRDDTFPKRVGLRGASLIVLAAYLGSAALLNGPVQVWLLLLAPFALVAIAMVLHIIDPCEPG